MTPEQAIQILDNVTAQVPLVRSDQAQVMQALQILRELIINSKEINTKEFNNNKEFNSVKEIAKEENN